MPALLSLRQRSDAGWHRFPPQNVDAAGQKAPTSRLQGGREGSNASGGHGERSCRLKAATGDDRPWGCRDKHPQRARPCGRHRQREPRARRWSSAAPLSPGSPHTTAPASPASCTAWEELRAGTLLRVFWHFTNSSVFPMQVEESRGGTDT